MFCLDTDVVSAVMRPGGGPPHLARRFAVVPAEEQFTTAITLGELLYGAERRGSVRLRAAIEELVARVVTVLPFDEAAARVYASLRTELAARGHPLAEPDLRIASIALSLDLTLVTGNVRHFERVPGLRVENWLERS